MFIEPYIVCHGTTDLLSVVSSTEPKKDILNLFNAYSSSIIFFNTLPVHQTIYPFILLSSIHFSKNFSLQGKTNISSILGALMFILSCMHFHVYSIMIWFLMYHSTIHYKHNLQLIKQHRRLFLPSCILSFLIYKRLLLENLFAFATGHIIFNDILKNKFI